jgi:hypothetical protein
MLAFWIQFWHHIEHGLLQAQALFQHNLFGSPVPMSIALPGEEAHQGCTCAWGARLATA